MKRVKLNHKPKRKPAYLRHDIHPADQPVIDLLSDTVVARWRIAVTPEQKFIDFERQAWRYLVEYLLTLECEV